MSEKNTTSCGMAELAKKLRLYLIASLPISRVIRPADIGERPAYSSMGLKYRNHTTSSRASGILRPVFP